VRSTPLFIFCFSHKDDKCLKVQMSMLDVDYRSHNLDSLIFYFYIKDKKSFHMYKIGIIAVLQGIAVSEALVLVGNDDWLDGWLS
jgi:hypothetical protein